MLSVRDILTGIALPEHFFIELIFILAFLVNVCHFHASTRQRMMLMKFGTGILYAFYFFCLDAPTAMMAAMISSFGGLAQACFADDVLHKTKKLRAGVAVCLAWAAIVVSAGSSLEALPLIAVINSRLVEIQSCRQRIRIGYIFSMACWITYAISSGMILLYITENINMLSNLYAIWREDKKRTQAVLAPAYAA